MYVGLLTRFCLRVPTSTPATNTTVATRKRKEEKTGANTSPTFSVFFVASLWWGKEAFCFCHHQQRETILSQKRYCGASSYSQVFGLVEVSFEKRPFPGFPTGLMKDIVVDFLHIFLIGTKRNPKIQKKGRNCKNQKVHTISRINFSHTCGNNNNNTLVQQQHQENTPKQTENTIEENHEAFSFFFSVPYLVVV